MKKTILCLTFAMSALSSAATPQVKIIDGGGSGPFKAEAVSDNSLPGFVVYRPADISAAAADDGPLPLLVFANGGCNDTSLPHEKLLNDVASYGYLVVALGEMQDSITDRELHKSPNSDMIRAIDWATTINDTPGSIYHNNINLDHIALGGQSCGGAQALANSSDPRVKTCLMINSGMGDIEMADAGRISLAGLHGPVLYLTGGESDIAYGNAELDYDRIDNVPVALASHLRAGHGGTFQETYGGSFSRMVRAWLNWQFKDRDEDLDIFLRNTLLDFPDYTMKAKNFPDVNNPFSVKEYNLRMRDGKNLWGKAYIPNTAEEKKPMVIMAHGFNGTSEEPRAYAETLAMQGVASFVFDFCGGGNNSRSDGATTDMTIFSEKENVEDIAGEVKSWDFVDPERVSLLGCSQGGLVSALTAAANPDMFKSLILVYPAFSIPETAPMMLKRFDNDGNRPQEVWTMKLGRQYYESINGLDVPEMASGFKGDVFIVYGDKDMIVAGNVDKTAGRYDRKEILVIPGGDHGFSDYTHHEAATAGITGFVRRTLKKQND